MGRELKRVALDFEWPENKVWSGYINPHYAKNHQCAACGGAGETTSRQRLGDLVSLLMLSGTDVNRWACHPHLVEAHLFYTHGKLCGSDMAELTSALAGRKPSSLGHCSIDKHSATLKIIAAAGLPEEWGMCPACNGEGSIWDSAEDEKAADEWSETSPPAGDGYQIWETVSEGSPISPVFATAEALAGHMAGKKWGADKGSSYESWMRFIEGPGWALSMVVDSRGCHTGPEAAA